MKQEVKLKDNTVILDTESVYSGSDILSEDEKLVRKAVGFPVTKQLIYYKDKKDSETAVNVKKFQLIEMFDITERWYTVEITLDDDTTVRIHSGYLIEMQKPSFIADMAAQNA